MIASAALKARVRRPALLSKLARAEDLIHHFPNGAYVGWSGFTGVGAPKLGKLKYSSVESIWALAHVGLRYLALGSTLNTRKAAYLKTCSTYGTGGPCREEQTRGSNEILLVCGRIFGSRSRESMGQIGHD